MLEDVRGRDDPPFDKRKLVLGVGHKGALKVVECRGGIPVWMQCVYAKRVRVANFITAPLLEVPSKGRSGVCPVDKGITLTQVDADSGLS